MADKKINHGGTRKTTEIHRKNNNIFLVFAAGEIMIQCISVKNPWLKKRN
jgi:hypothetical protein